MAEILLEPLYIVSNGFLNGKGSRIIKSNSIIFTVSASFAGKTTLIKKAKTNISSDTGVDGKTVLIKKTQTYVLSDASLVAAKGRLIKYISGSSSSKVYANVDSKKYKTVRGVLVSGSILEAFTYERDVQASYERYLPKLYQEFEDISKMMQVEANEVTRLLARINSIVDQSFANSSTYALDRWEKELGIETIPQRSTDSRRHYILAKLRGMKTTTKQVLKEIADSFYESEIIEKPSDYEVEIKIVGRRGEPKNAEDMHEAIANVIPAHVSHNIAFTYLPWSELDVIHRSWGEVNAYKMADASALEWRKFEGDGARWNSLSTLTADELEESYNLNLEEVMPNEQ